MRRELFELMPVLPAIDRVFGWLFKPVGVALWTILGLTALLRLASRIESADLFSWAQQFSTAEAFALFLVFFGLKLVHELGRAVALRRMAAAEGLPLHSVRAGVALMLLAPFPFTNASAAWGLASKWRRAAVGVAGMYVESWAAIFAILLWSISDDVVLRSACLQVATVAGVTTLVFNLNPLGRMDGYYILGDLLERPNLAQRGQGGGDGDGGAAVRHSPCRRPGAPGTGDAGILAGNARLSAAGLCRDGMAGAKTLASRGAAHACHRCFIVARAPGAGDGALADRRSRRTGAGAAATVGRGRRQPCVCRAGAAAGGNCRRRRG